MKDEAHKRMGMKLRRGLMYWTTEVQEGAPTSDQLGNILEYLGPAKAGSVVTGATGATDALKKFKSSENAFQRPVVVDWMNGRAGKLYEIMGGWEAHSCSFVSTV